MKNVLFITYSFPPIGGAGVQRSAKFAKYLPDFGYRPVVLTVRPQDYAVRREFQLDKTHVKEVGLQCEIHRARDWEPRRLRTLLEKRYILFQMAWFLFYPVFWERAAFWALGAIPRALRLIRIRRACAIYTTSPPFSVIITGFVLKALARVPWVADLRDPWTQDAMYLWPSRLHYRATAAAERFMLRRADVVIANTPLASERMKAHLGKDFRGRVVTIPNGYDAADFPPCPSAPPQKEKPLVIAHIGTFYTQLGPPGDGRSNAKGARSAIIWLANALKQAIGYWPVPQDWPMRSPKVLLEGLKLLYDREPALRGRIRLSFVGHLDERWRRMAMDLGLGDVVDAPGYLPHAEALRRLCEADVLYCVQVGFADAARPVPYVPAKLYEYLATGKPILAPLAPGDTKEVLRESGLGIFCDPHRPQDVARAILELYTNHRNGCISVKPNWEFIRKFERRRTAQQLACVLGACAKA